MALTTKEIHARHAEIKRKTEEARAKSKAYQDGLKQRAREAQTRRDEAQRRGQEDRARERQRRVERDQQEKITELESQLESQDSSPRHYSSEPVSEFPFVIPSRFSWPGTFEKFLDNIRIAKDIATFPPDPNDGPDVLLHQTKKVALSKKRGWVMVDVWERHKEIFGFRVYIPKARFFVHALIFAVLKYYAWHKTALYVSYWAAFREVPHCLQYFWGRHLHTKYMWIAGRQLKAAGYYDEKDTQVEPAKETPQVPAQSDNAPYDMLGVSRLLTLQEIESKYHELCRLYHPDKYANSPEEFKRVAEAKMKDLNQAMKQIRKERY